MKESFPSKAVAEGKIPSALKMRNSPHLKGIVYGTIQIIP